MRSAVVIVTVRGVLLAAQGRLLGVKISMIAAKAARSTKQYSGGRETGIDPIFLSGACYGESCVTCSSAASVVYAPAVLNDPFLDTPETRESMSR